MRRAWLFVVLPIFLAACGTDEHSDVRQWMKESSKDLRGHVPPLPEVKPFPVVSYDASDLVDPFQPSKIEPEKKLGGGGKQPDFNRRKEELERYPLESLKFVGLLRQDKMLYAVIMADKKVYRVKIGNYMGQDYGMVTDIKTSPSLDEGKLILRELVQDPTGDWVERESVLELQVQEGNK